MHYQKNYLTNVILRLDFEPIQALRESKKVEIKPEFSARLASIYPIVVGQPTAMLSLNIGPTGSGINQQITGIQWHHRKAENGTRVIVLAPDFLSVEYGKGDYDHFPPFRGEVEVALTALQGLYSVSKFTRIGLRYINEISIPEGNALEWTGIIAPDLVTAALAGKEANASVVRSMHQLHVRQDECEMVFNYGIHNPDFPNTLARRAFILDYDCSKSGVESGQALETIDKLNRVCETMFEQSIGPDLRGRMVEIHEN